MLDAATRSVERARAAGQYVQGAAAAVGTLYTGVLTLSFAANQNPLPLRGLLPTFFLALAVGLSAFYVAFFTKPRGTASPDYGTTADEERMLLRANWFVRWSNRTADNRQEFLRGAVVSLALGVALLPIAFLDVSAGPTTADPTANPPQQAAVEPSPTASATPWPTPEFDSPEALAAVLYDAQLEEFREADKASAGDEGNDLGLVIVLGVAGLVLVGTAMAGPWLWGWFRSSSGPG